MKKYSFQKFTYTKYNKTDQFYKIYNKNCIAFCGDFNETIEEETIKLLKKYENIYLGKKFNKSIDILSNCNFITKLALSEDFNQQISIFPPNLIYLEMGRNFNQELNNLPSTLEYIKTGYLFNQPLNNLPISFVKLVIDGKYNQPLDDILSLKVLHVMKYSEFNQTLDRLPEGLEHIDIENEYNCSLDCLPVGLKILELGKNYDKPLNNLPVTLNFLHLRFDKYCQPLDNLPGSLEKIILNGRYNIPLNNLPYGIKTIVFGDEFNQPLHNLPGSIENISLGTKFNQSLDCLSDGVRSILFSNDSVFNRDITKYPKNLRKICFPGRYKKKLVDLPDGVWYLDYSGVESIDEFPQSLKVLAIRGDYKYYLDNLNDGLEVLYLGGYYNISINNLPNSIKIISFNKKSLFNKEIKRYPQSIQKLEFGWNFNQPLVRIPEGLRLIVVDKLFNQSLDYLPNSVELIQLGNYYSKEYNESRDDSEFNQDINNLPSNLKYIVFESCENDYLFKEFIRKDGKTHLKNDVYIGNVDIREKNIKTIKYLHYSDFVEHEEYDFENTLHTFSAFISPNSHKIDHNFLFATL